MNRGRRDVKILTSLCLLIALVVADEVKISDSQSQDNRCFGKHGVFLPSLKSCNEYLICVQGVTVINSCGDNHFNAQLGVCDRPERAGCIISRPEFMPLFEAICLGKEDGTKLPMDGNSSQYFLCNQGYAQLKDCGKLTFDREVLECVGVTREQPCLGVRNGARVAVGHDSRKYYLCMNNRAFLKSCGDLFFSVKTSSCSLEPDVENLAPVPALLQEIPVQETIKNQIASIIKSRPIKVDIVSLPQIKPLLIAPNPPVLPSQENPVKEVVKEPHPIATIVKSKPSKLDVFPQEQETPDEPNRLALRICQGQQFGARLPIPGTCSHYYICMGNTGTLKNCGQTQFNPEIAACDLASNVKCNVQQGVAVYGPKDTETDPKPQDFDILKICQGERDRDFFSVPGNCSQFYFCFQNTVILKDCGKRHFNPITMSCVDLEMSKCVDGIATKPVTKIDTQMNCLSRDNGVLLKHPTDCGKFLLCDNHKAVEMICPAGLHFNVNRNYCDWPDLAKCT